jgi:serpin B
MFSLTGDWFRLGYADVNKQEDDVKIRLLSVALAIGLVMGCAGTGTAATPPAEPAPEPPDPALVGQLVRQDNRFGIELFQQLFQAEPGKNLFISPTSIAMALAMTWNGADGETRDAMALTLGFEGVAEPDVNKANRFLLESLRSADEDVQLEVANSNWGREGIPFSDEFKKTNSLSYRAKMFLINAVYFKGRWTAEFDKKLTQDRDFHRADGSVKSHPMMRREDKYRYLETDDLQAIRLPYGEDRFALYVFLPGSEQGLAEFVDQLTPETLDDRLMRMHRRKGEIVLPKFKHEYEQNLNTVLGALGMDIAFDPGRADFYRMLDSPIDMAFYISEVLHKTFVEVNEEGTEAAAVTSVRMTLTALPPDEDFQMTVDRPFFYMIRDDESGAVLFMGVVTEPEL